MTRTRLFGNRELWWESGGLTSPAVTVVANRIQMLYAAKGEDGISRLGLAVSDDGEGFVRLETPTVESNEAAPLERLGFTDPRAVIIGKEIFLTYTALSTLPLAERPTANANWPHRSRTVVARTRDFQRLEPLGLPFPTLNTGAAVLLPAIFQRRYWLFYTLGEAIYLSYSTNLKSWQGGLQLLGPKEKWEQSGLTVACPPVETERGWLFFYNTAHGIGLVLLDRNNPAVLLKRLGSPLIQAEESWEKPSVTLSGVLQQRGSLWLYYGAKAIGLTKVDLESTLAKIDES